MHTMHTTQQLESWEKKGFCLGNLSAYITPKPVFSSLILKQYVGFIYCKFRFWSSLIRLRRKSETLRSLALHRAFRLENSVWANTLWSLDGVVGYHVRLTRERSSVRTRVETFFAFFSCSHPPHDVRNLSTKFQVNRSSFEAAAVASRRAWSNLP